ncbi:unnamed protein product, partial [Allacma fusca]
MAWLRSIQKGGSGDNSSKALVNVIDEAVRAGDVKPFKVAHFVLALGFLVISLTLTLVAFGSELAWYDIARKYKTEQVG